MIGRQRQSSEDFGHSCCHQTNTRVSNIALFIFFHVPYMMSWESEASITQVGRQDPNQPTKRQVLKVLYKLIN